MAEYTIELRHVVEQHNIFDFNYPFYNEKLRPEFEEKFIRHFYFREICCPTIDRFKVYLEDKMKTVFPYYNELFNAANIEYSILNNYNLTEEFVTERDTKGNTAGVSSTVGQLFGIQETETQANRETIADGKSNTIGQDTETETTKTTTDATGNSVTETSGNSKTETSGTSDTDTSNNQNVNGSDSRTTKDTGSSTKHSVQKFLDTPQGLTNLSDSNYVTNLTDVDETGSTTHNVTEQGSNDQVTTGTGTSKTDTTGSSETNTSGNSETDTTDNSETNGSRNGEKNSTVNQTTEGKETTDDQGHATVTDEQKTTQDNNTRTFMDTKQTEKHTLTRIGNIGVDTDSDMIEKHIRLQKTLKQIELLFFNECEDLFMMVY